MVPEGWPPVVVPCGTCIKSHTNRPCPLQHSLHFKHLFIFQWQHKYHILLQNQLPLTFFSKEWAHTDFNYFNQLHFIFIFCWEFWGDKSRHNCDLNAGVFKHVTTTSYYDQETLTFLMRAILPFYIPPPINLHIAQESKSCFKMWLGFSSFLLLSYNNYLIQKIHLKIGNL